MPRPLLCLVTVLFALAASAPAASGQDRPDLRRVVLTNGDIYVGTVADEAADPVVVVTTDGIERRFPRDRVALVAPLIRGRFFRTDPVRTRLFFAPTARPLGGGDVRADLAYVFPSITAGLSDRVDLLASGFLIVGDGGGATPLVGFKATVVDGPAAQVAVGTSALFVIGGGDDGFLAVPYGVVTLGDETQSVSFGIGAAVGGSVGSADLSVAEGVLLGFGAETQVNNGVKLLGEALLGLTGEDSGLLFLPGVRLFGDRFAFDVFGYVATDFEGLSGFAPAGGRISYTF